MTRFIKFWKIILLDILGVLFILAGILASPIPGPGGIPLFIIGLSLFAVHHEWAKKYIHRVKKYSHKLGDLIFVKNPKIQLIYDLVSPFVVLAGILFIIHRKAFWMISLGIFMIFLGLTFILGNRGRWKRIKSLLSNKH